MQEKCIDGHWKKLYQSLQLERIDDKQEIAEL